MRHVMALIIKTVMVAAVFLIILSFINNYPVGSTFLLALLTVGISYVVGDLWILPMSNNTIATLSDVILCTAKIWIIGSILYGVTVPFSLAFLTSVVLGVGEWFFHKYVSTSVLPEQSPQTTS